ncbi:MAG: hypothetical protein ABI251_06130 [Mycobacteriaceae bacterium]
MRYIHSILQRALDDAVRTGQLSVNPARLATPLSARSAAAPEMRTWSRDELAGFLPWCRAPVADAREAGREELAFAWELLAMTGLRRGELLALRWGDMDFRTGRLAVRRSYTAVRSKGKPELRDEGAPKTGKARVLDLDDRRLRR